MASTLEEIAALAGVSRSTVSRVINESPRVDEVTRARVLRVVREHNYHPNSAARALVNRRSEVIGLVVPQALNAVFADPYFPLLIQGASSAADERGYYMMLSFTPVHSAQSYGRIVRGAHLDGLIVASALYDDPFVARLIEERFPFVLIGRHPGEETIATVDVDNVQGAMMAVQHLARLGNTRIATITGMIHMVAGVDRREGYLAGLRACGLPVLPGYIKEGDWSEWSGMRGMEALLRLPERPQAVFVASDAMAVGALKMLRSAGLRCPEDIALVGFDDIPLASIIEPALTTVRQPIQRLGNMAASLLIDELLHTTEENPRALQRLMFGTELIVRDSCGQALKYGAPAS